MWIWDQLFSSMHGWSALEVGLLFEYWIIQLRGLCEAQLLACPFFLKKSLYCYYHRAASQISLVTLSKYSHVKHEYPTQHDVTNSNEQLIGLAL